MRRLISLATAALAASVLASAPAAAQSIRSEVLQRTCSDMTLNQIGEKLGEYVQKYQFSSNPEEAEQQAIGLLCPSALAAHDEQPADTGRKAADVKEANLVQEVMLPPVPPHRLPPPPRFRQPPRGMMPPLVSIQRLPPPPPGGYGRRHAPPRVAMGGRNFERYEHHEGRRITSTRHRSSYQHRSTNYCPSKEEVAPPPSHARDGTPYVSCEWVDQVPNRPCGGYHCSTR